MPENKCLFQAKWLDDPRCSLWLKKKSYEVALCSYCKREINIGNMGETAFTPHLKGKNTKKFPNFPVPTLLQGC